MRAIATVPSPRHRWQMCIGIFLAFCLVGCSEASRNDSAVLTQNSEAQQNLPAQNKKIVLTTFTVLADMARNVAGDKIIVESLTKIGSEIHGYEPTPSDLVKAQKADLILDNGFGLERWAERFYQNLKAVPHITLSETIQPINIAEDAYAGKPNPHAWMSPQNALIYVENIRKAFVELDPENTETYNANAAAYSEQIKALDQRLKAAIAQIPAEKRYMVTCEGAFSYLAKDYNLKEVYLWAVNSEQQATPKQVQKVVDTVRQNRIPTVFCESTVNADAQKQVAQESGAKFGGLFYVDSLSEADGVVPTYLTLLEYNINTLIEGLKKE